MNPSFWQNRRVFLTGHTGFKGAWLSLWLQKLGAQVTGYALAPDTQPNLFEARPSHSNSIIADIRDRDALHNALAASRAEVVFHLAAQPLVRDSYARPVDTYATNVMGTVHLLDACREVDSVRAIVVVTTDKVYENREWPWPYREADRLGGRDPYSNSKACAELVVSAYRASFFSDTNNAAVATARAGNVIGGGDWARDRLVPDLLRAFAAGESALVRNPGAVRPWQHVLEPLHGYLLLAEGLFEKRELAGAWNFGPYEHDVHSVRAIADALAAHWGGASWRAGNGEGPHEAMMLRLDSSRARTALGWTPRLTTDAALQWIVEWHRRFEEDSSRAHDVTLEQIERYEAVLA